MELKYRLVCKTCGHEFVARSEDLIDEDTMTDSFTVVCPECETEGTDDNFRVKEQWEI